MRAPAALPGPALASGVSARRPAAPGQGLGRPPAVTRPVSPMSRAASPTRVATQGTPQAMASPTRVGEALVAWRTAPAGRARCRRRPCRRSGRATGPGRQAQVPGQVLQPFRGSRQGRPPTQAKRASGRSWATRAAARRKVGWSFTGSRRPTIRGGAHPAGRPRRPAAGPRPRGPGLNVPVSKPLGITRALRGRRPAAWWLCAPGLGVEDHQVHVPGQAPGGSEQEPGGAAEAPRVGGRGPDAPDLGTCAGCHATARAGRLPSR